MSELCVSTFREMERGAGSSESPASPWDYIKAGTEAADRAASLGLTSSRLDESYGLNQSFPRASLTRQQVARRLESPGVISRTRMVSPYIAATARSTDCLANCSLLAQGGRGSRMMQNPNKAWAIINESGSILVNNGILSTLLGYTDQELKKLTLWELVSRRSGDRRQEVLDQLDIDPVSGDTTAINGRVVSVRCADQQQVTVSVNIHQLPDSSRHMVHMEPVHRTVGFIDLDSEGRVMDVDTNIEAIFQVRREEVTGECVSRLIPSMEWPDQRMGSVTRFTSTGRIDEDSTLPLSCVLTRGEAGMRAGVWVYSSLSGLLLLDGQGRVSACDETFASLVLGYTAAGLVGRSVEDIMPGFYDEFEVPSCDRTDDDLGCEEISPEIRSCDILDQIGADVSPLEEISLNVRSLNLNSPKLVSKSVPGSPIVFKNPQLIQSNCKKENIEDSPIFKRPDSLSVKTPVKVPMDMLTSTPSSAKMKQSGLRARPEASLDRPRPLGKQLNRPRSRQEQRPLVTDNMPSGCFYGLARHRTGAEVSILYQVKRIVLRSSEVVTCVWVTRDTDDGLGRTHDQLTLASTIEADTTAPLPLGDCVDTSEAPQETRAGLEESKVEDTLGASVSVDALTRGDYADNYVTLNQIGKGAFGFVFTAYKTSDSLLVVTKFIRKSKVCPDMWVDGGQGNKIPFEVSLLLALKHPGIVNIIDVFQNQSFVQMVMGKHGDMDLFEFIDRNPMIDETLASVIFRQVVSAVGFLHSREILHRDIKDENIIIDHNFQCRLIDFGSATFFKPGQLFSTFYGTVEYCSPEVLKGHPYKGPELEMWSLGVLLYILMFGENPFYNEADTRRAEIHPPHNDASEVCMELIEACLEADPARRASLWYVQEHRWLNFPASADDYNFSEVIPCNAAEMDPPTHYQVIQKRLMFICYGFHYLYLG